MDDDQSDGTDWSDIFDIFASRYKFNLDEFFKLTSRQVSYLMDAIIRNIYKERQFEAALHKLKMKDGPPSKTMRAPKHVDKAQFDLIKQHRQRMIDQAAIETRKKNG